MAKVTLSNLANLDNPVTAVAVINANNDAIEAAMELTLTRTGTSPNTMSANLDMNNNRITNLPEPVNPGEPLRKAELDNLVVDLDDRVLAADASADAAAASAVAAAASASAAAVHVTTANTHATTASGHATTALGYLNDFKGRYYGAQSSDPALDPLGAAINAGDLYWNTTSSTLKVYNGSAWVTGAFSATGASGVTLTPTGDVAATNVQDGIAELASEKATTASVALKLNSSAVSAFGLTLIDDADAATARTTLGVGDVWLGAATTDRGMLTYNGSNFPTSAQSNRWLQVPANTYNTVTLPDLGTADEGWTVTLLIEGLPATDTEPFYVAAGGTDVILEDDITPTRIYSYGQGEILRFIWTGYVWVYECVRGPTKNIVWTYTDQVASSTNVATGSVYHPLIDHANLSVQGTNCQPGWSRWSQSSTAAMGTAFWPFVSGKYMAYARAYYTTPTGSTTVGVVLQGYSTEWEGAHDAVVSDSLAASTYSFWEPPGLEFMNMTSASDSHSIHTTDTKYLKATTTADTTLHSLSRLSAFRVSSSNVGRINKIYSRMIVRYLGR